MSLKLFHGCSVIFDCKATPTLCANKQIIENPIRKVSSSFVSPIINNITTALNNDASISIAPKFTGIDSIPSAVLRGEPIPLDIIAIDVKINVTIVIIIIVIIIKTMDNISFGIINTHLTA